MKVLNSLFLVLLLILGVFSLTGYLIKESVVLSQNIAEKDARIAELIAELDQIKANLNELTPRIGQLQSELDKSQFDRQALLTKVDELQNATLDLKKDLEGKDIQLADVQAKLDQALAEYQTVVQQLDSSNTSLQQTQQVLNQTQQDLTANQIALTSTNEILRQTQIERDDLLQQKKSTTLFQGGVFPENIGIITGAMVVTLVIMLTILRLKLQKRKLLQRTTIHTPRGKRPLNQVTVKMNSLAYQTYLDYIKEHKQ